MPKHILFDALTGALTARYDSAIHGENIPAEAIAVDDELFFQTINEQDGIWSLVEGEIVKVAPTPKTPAELLKEAKVAKRVEIRKAYDEAAIAPVDALEKTWDGGFESAIKLDAAMRLSQAAGAEGVVFFDATNLPHPLGFDDALQVCIAVAVAYQTTLAKKQDLYAQIDAATTVKKVEAILW